ncbi:hypothetical protein T552_04111 [Pneumocystis carinii B80]|uniref:Uncharacterized protein n=1 Tax=Pneumocystis carinii (strain B80) TaxID=1408658 RepID=A0A0W4ZLY2_PNEC8|nr:hypothetical protein T552_04111 [Pneumocystis carinii B80]KTW29400.1 hypothetical protein T552_04111 [Pneumocystis carinii B80]
MDSIYLHKKAFIESQISLLSRPLDPPPNWRENAKLDEDGNELSEAAVIHAIYCLNVLLRKQYRIIFSSQAIRHVSEQIDRLYHSSNEVSLIEPVQCDFQSLDDIEKLPAVWPSDDEKSSEKYTNLRARLLSLAPALDHLQQKHAFYESIESSLRQLRQQTDLSSRISVELERTKKLTAKIGQKLKKSNIKLNPQIQQTEPESFMEFCSRINPDIIN